jgi:hypothetical protein
MFYCHNTANFGVKHQSICFIYLDMQIADEWNTYTQVWY